MLDSHVLTRAAMAELAGSPADELRLVDRIESVCSVIVWTRISDSEVTAHIRPRVMGPLFQALPLFRRLDELGKIVRPAASALSSLTAKQRKTFRRKGHDDITLFEAAMATDKLLITADRTLLKRRRDTEAATSVKTIDVADALVP